jgi:hypothetical protein
MLWLDSLLYPRSTEMFAESSTSSIIPPSPIHPSLFLSFTMTIVKFGHRLT